MNNAVLDNSFDFAVRVVKLCKYLQSKHKDYSLCKQLFRSGTSIGANIAEAQQAQSTADFVSKLSIALKESSETDYWLRLMYATEYLSQKEFASLIADCRELEKLLVSIINTSKNQK